MEKSFEVFFSFFLRDVATVLACSEIFDEQVTYLMNTIINCNIQFKINTLTA